MSYAIQTGPAWVLKEQHFFYDIQRGGQVVNVYEGTPNGIAQVKAGLRNWDKAEEDSSDSPRIRLTVTSPDLNEATVWELVTNDKQRTVDQHPDYSAISLANRQLIDWYFNPTTDHAQPTLPDDFVADGTNLVAAAAWLLMLKGETFWAEDVVLRYVTTVTNARQVKLAYANSGKLFSTSQLTTYATSGLIIPPGIYSAIWEADAAKETSSDATLSWAWLKKKPQSRQTRMGKVEITGEFWGGLWRNTLYAAVT